MAALPEAAAVIRAAGLAAGLFVAGALASLIAPRLDQRPADPLGQIIGSAKEAVGDAFFLKADEYMHGGVKGRFEHKEGDMQKEGLIEELKEHGSHEAHGDWILRINERINTHGHYHLKEGERQEILPLLAASVSLDPYNVEAVLTTAYWLERHFGKITAAQEVLQKGRKDNPESWEIDSALGDMNFKQRKDYERSIFHYQEALRKLGSGDVPRAVRTGMRVRMAESYLSMGRADAALEQYETAMALFGPDENPPLKEIIRSKITELKGQAAP